MRKIILLLVLILLISFSFADECGLITEPCICEDGYKLEQYIEEEWDMNYDRSGFYDNLLSADVDDLGNVYVTGGVTTTNNNLLSISKYSSNGNQIWRKEFDDGTIHTPDKGDEIKVGPNGVYVVGDEYLIKYDLSGNLLWSKKDTDNSGDLSRLSINNSEDIVVAYHDIEYIWVGPPQYYVYDHTNWYIKKYNSNGNILWTKKIEVESGNIYDVVLDNLGNTYLLTLVNGSIEIIKFDNLGNQIWNKILYPAKYPLFIDISSEEAIYIYFSSGDVYSTIYSLGKFDLEGNEIFRVDLDQLGSASNLHISSDNFVYNYGAKRIRKFDYDGNIIFITQTHQPGTFPYNMYGAVANNDGNIFVYGNKNSGDSTTYDQRIEKYVTKNRCVVDNTIVGECGIQLNECNVGSAENIDENSTHYKWSCTTNNGLGEDCSIEKIPINGICGVGVDTCEYGNYINIDNNSTHLIWQCIGIDGGLDSNCFLEINIGPNKNSIENFEVRYNNNLEITSDCIFTDIDANIEIFRGNELVYSSIEGEITCPDNENSFTIDLTLEDKTQYNAILTINEPCDNCSEQVFFNAHKKQEVAVPENNFFVLILLIGFIVFLIKKEM